MTKALSKNSLVYLGAFCLLIFVIIGVLGAGHTASMRTNDDGSMEGCIFTGKTMLCKMSAIEHIGLWQSMFTDTPQKFSALMALIFLFGAVFFALAYYNSSKLAEIKRVSIQFLHVTRHPDVSLFNSLRRAFAQGIIHPQIYKALIS